MFSTMTGWPHFCAIWSTMILVNASSVDPGGNGRITLTSRDGNLSWANAGTPGVTASSAIRSSNRSAFMSAPSSSWRNVSALSQMLDHHAVRENLVDLGMAMGDALLVSVAHELLERRAVLIDAIGEGVAV